MKECETNQKSNKVLSAPSEERITAFVHSTCLLEELYKFALTNQKHYTDVGSYTPSIQNFCGPSSGLISWENQWWCREMTPVFNNF